jgi:two-component system invasion response regulator UvrY
MNNLPAIRVAYVDDNTAVRKGIISYIQGLGDITVEIEAANGIDLLAQLNRKPLPDVCILDISMPEMDGFETLKRLKKLYPALGILVLTIHKVDYYIVRMIREGANGYLLKSCDPIEIKKAMSAICQQGFYYSNTITSRFVHDIRTGNIKLPNFTDREIEVLRYCCTDLTYHEIAAKMNTTHRSIQGFRDSLFKKLNVCSRVGLAMFATQFGLVPIEVKISPNADFLRK